MSGSVRPTRHVRRTPKPSRIALLLASAFLGLLAAANTAWAQALSEQELLFQQMLRNPKDVEVTFAYVKAATARGDYEAAIGALERILFYQPGLTRVK